MTLVLVPGFMTDDALWTDFADELAEFGPAVHADLGIDDTIPAMARRVLAKAPPQFVLIGFSLGGYVAREIARREPDRVLALILVATSARADTPQQSERKVAAIRVATAPFRGLSRSAITSSLHPERATDENLIERIRAMGVRLGGDAFRRQSNLTRDGDLDRLAEIHCPTLIIAGAQDRLRSLGEATELNEGIAGSTLEIIDGSGHMIPMEQPIRLAVATKSWLRSLKDIRQ